MEEIAGPIEETEKPKEETAKEEKGELKNIYKSNIKDVNKFDRLVKRNKESGRYWYYGLKGKWWWGMTKEQVRKKIESGQSLGGSQKVVIASIMRDEEHNSNLKRFLNCCQELEKYHDLVYVFIEGDSSDKTYDVLKDWLVEEKNYILKKVDRKYGHFAKNRDQKRTIYFAELRNMLIDSILSIPEISEVLMIDANYGWKGDIVSSLRKTKADISAPLVVGHKDHGGKYLFYDTWAFRKNGREFTSRYPYINGFDPKKPIKVDSVGGGYLINRDVLEAEVRYDGHRDCEHVGFCRRAKKKGFITKINPKIVIKKGGYKR